MRLTILGERITSFHPECSSGYVLLLSESLPFSVKTISGSLFENCLAALISPFAADPPVLSLSGPVLQFRFNTADYPADSLFPLSECDLLKTFFTKAESPEGSFRALFFHTLSDRITDTAECLLKECGNPDPYAADLSLCYLSALLLELCRCGSVISENLPADTVKIEFDRIINYIKERNANVSLNHVAAAFHYHPKTISSLIQRETGHSFSYIRNELRIQNAAKLIRSGCSVQEAASLCGYTNMTNFYKQFNLYIGITPGMYRIDPLQSCAR